MKTKKIYPYSWSESILLPIYKLLKAATHKPSASPETFKTLTSILNTFRGKP